MPVAIDRDLFSAPEADIDATRTARVGGYLVAETYSVVFVQKVVTIGIQSLRIFDHEPVGFATGEKSPGSVHSNAGISSLMVEVWMAGDEKTEPVWPQPYLLHIRKD